MTEAVRQRLFGWQHAFDSPFTLWATIFIVGLAVTSPLAILALRFAGRLSDKAYAELLARCLTWAVLVPLMFAPILAGAFWTILAVAVLSVLCYLEFARNTPLRDAWAINSAALIGIVALACGSLDRWWEFFSGAIALTIVTIAAVTIFRDQPRGYLQRVALGVLGFGLFGSALGHLGYFANDENYRPTLILILLATEANDIFAYLSGKTLGSRKLIPNTSPNKTIGGSVGALILTSALVVLLGPWIFAGSQLAQPLHLAGLGLLISALGQLGDLVMSSVKRDLGIKDLGTVLPGHGGLLDRFDSLLLVAPAVFYYHGLFRGLLPEGPAEIFSSAWR
jgi:phosphatidate cytidylyltransferase